MTNSQPRRRSTRTRHHQEALFAAHGRVDVSDGIALYKHSKSRFIWADFSLPEGSRRRESTRTASFDAASAHALRRFRDLQHRADKGLPIASSGPTVGDLLAAYLKTLDGRLEAGDRSTKPEISVVRRNLIPYWSQIPLTSLSRQTFYGWEDWRAAPADTVVGCYERDGRTINMGRQIAPPSPATLGREKNYLVRALAWGADQVSSWLSDEAVHEIRHLPRRKKRSVKERRETETRDALSPDEVAALVAEFARWDAAERQRAAELGEKGRGRNYERRLMGLHVRLLLASGMRPGTEILDITWGRVQTARLTTGAEIIVINQCGSGKTGPRIVNCSPDAVEIIEDLKALHHECGFEVRPDATLWPSRRGRGHVTRDMNKSFKSVLRKLKFDERVQDEPLYICRHTYITSRLRQGISSDVLATNCGTSVEMIERHYKHLDGEKIRDKLFPASTGGELILSQPPAEGGPTLKLVFPGRVSRH